MDDADRVAERLWTTARDEEQAVAVVADDELADRIRERVRRLARAEGIAVRTARLENTVVVVRLDARIWDQDAATMREKLSPGTDT